MPLINFAQKNEIEVQLIQAYQQEHIKKTGAHFELHFIDTASLSDFKELKQIMLIRHQKVDIDKQLLYNYRKLEQYKSDYDIEEVLPVHVKTILNAEDIDTVFTSSLHRSRKTAALLLGNEFIYEANPIFNELNPGTVNIPLLYLPKPLWSGLNRFFWMFGSKPKSTTENRTMAQRRVNAAADLLDYKAKENGKLILVAHGYMNHLLRKRLKRLGWILVEHTGNENLGGSLLVKVEN